MRIIKGKHNFGDGEVYSVTATELKHMDRIVSYGATEKEAMANFRNKILGYKWDIESISAEIDDSNFVSNNTGQINIATGNSSITANQEVKK